MKRKTIELELNKVFNKWLNSINDDNVKAIVKNNTIITGGCIASMLLKEDVNDYDIYFRNKETVLEIIKYYIKESKKIAEKIKQSLPDLEIKVWGKKLSTLLETERLVPWERHSIDNVKFDNFEIVERLSIYIRSQGIIKFDNKANKKVFKYNEFKPIFLTSNAITLTDKVQLIIRFFGEPDDIHSNYDFDHCKSYWDSKSKKLVIPGNTAEALLSRELKYTGSKYPLSSIIRTRKFIRKGWSIQAGEFLKMAVQLNQLNLMDVNVLEDQLIGVDTTYFQILINNIREQKEKNENFELTSGYLIEKINQIFHDNTEEYQEGE